MGLAAEMGLGTAGHPSPELLVGPRAVAEELLEFLLVGCWQGLGHSFHVLGRELGQQAVQIGLGVDGPVVGARVEDGRDGFHIILETTRRIGQGGRAFTFKKAALRRLGLRDEFVRLFRHAARSFARGGRNDKRKDNDVELGGKEGNT